MGGVDDLGATGTRAAEVGGGAQPDGRRRRAGASALGWALHGLVVAGAAGAVALDRRLRRSRVGDVPVAQGVVSVAFYGLLWAVESRRPYREDWRPDRADVATDAAFLASVVAVQGVGMAVAAPVVRRVTRTAGVERLPTPVGVAAAVLAYDLVHSRLHQLGHQWGPAWRIHSVHHSPERLYWFNATRFQGLEMFVDMVLESVVVAALGLSRDQHVAYQAVRGMYGQLQHTNADLCSGALDHVFSTPDLHRWHHSTVYAEGDTNYGAVTSLWDRVFGTFHRPVGRRGPEHVGVGRMPDFPQRFWELERVPADWSAIRRRNAATWDAEDDRTSG